MTVWNELEMLRNQLYTQSIIIWIMLAIIIGLALWIWVKYRIEKYNRQQQEKTMLDLGVKLDQTIAEKDRIRAQIGGLHFDDKDRLRMTWHEGYLKACADKEREFDERERQWKSGLQFELDQLQKHNQLLNNRPDNTSEAMQLFKLVESLRVAMAKDLPQIEKQDFWELPQITEGEVSEL